MSNDNVIRFMKRLASDSALADEVGQIERNGGADAVARLLEIAEREKCAFTEPELERVLPSIRQQATGELGDDQLEQVSAGLGDMTLQETGMLYSVETSSDGFTSMSNILKTKYDTTKNSISNIR